MAEGAVAAVPEPLRVLVVDDEESMRYYLRRALARRGYQVAEAAGGAQALERLEDFDAAVVVTDLKMPGMSGIELLAALRARDPECGVVLMTAFGTIASAVEAMQKGAGDYITKPFQIDDLVAGIERVRRPESRPAPAARDYGGLIGDGPAMRAVQRAIDLLRETDATVLLTGESGTGKELVARAIHAGSARAKAPFMALSCAALRDTLVESELFGYLPGAFTGAHRAKPGLIARADGGTLFLDEIGEVSLATQAKLDRFLQTRELVPLGGSTPVAVDTRVIAATNRDLDQAVQLGAFRRELLYRLNVVPVRLPPLRERREDIGPLAEHFLARHATSLGVATPELSDDALARLAEYDWPGNVRELQNAIEGALALHPALGELDVEHLPPVLQRHDPAPAESASALSYQDAVVRAEREYLTRLFRRTGGNISETARLAGLSRGHLHRKVKQLGLDPRQFRG